MLLGLGVVWTVVQAQAPIAEPDAWWHLRLGEEFRNGSSLSHPAALSPFASQPWVPTQWLFEVAASDLVQWLGVGAVPWLVAVAASLVALALFVACRLNAGTLPATVATLAALGAVSVFFVPRPQIASFVLLAVFVGAWLQTVNDLKPRWWLVPLSYLWACAHGMWMAGPLLGLAATVGLMLDRRLARHQVIRLLGVSVLGLAVAALTPVGPRLLLGPLNVSSISGLIVEWQPPNFREPDTALTATLLIAVFVTWSRRPSPTSWARLLMLALACGWTVYSARTVPLGAIIAAPLVAEAMSSWLHEATPTRGARRDVAVAAIFAGSSLVLATLSMRPEPAYVSMVGAEVDRKLDTLPAGSVVFNEYRFGGWLEYQHRQVTPVVDGLTESFSVKYLVEHNVSLRVAPGWNTLIDQTRAEYALLFEATPLSLQLRDQGWTVMAKGQAPTGEPVLLLQRRGGLR